MYFIISKMINFKVNFTTYFYSDCSLSYLKKKKNNLKRLKISIF